MVVVEPAAAPGRPPCASRPARAGAGWPAARRPGPDRRRSAGDRVDSATAGASWSTVRRRRRGGRRWCRHGNRPGRRRSHPRSRTTRSFLESRAMAHLLSNARTPGWRDALMSCEGYPGPTGVNRVTAATLAGVVRPPVPDSPGGATGSASRARARRLLRYRTARARTGARSRRPGRTGEPAGSG